MTKILSNIYDRFIAIVFGTLFFVLLGDCENFFLTKCFSKSSYLFIQKTAEPTLLKRDSTYQVLLFDCVDGTTLSARLSRTRTTQLKGYKLQVRNFGVLFQIDLKS